MDVKKNSINLFHFFWSLYATGDRLSIGVDLQFLAVENSDCDVIGIFSKYVSFVVVDTVEREIDLSVGLDAFINDFAELSDGSVFLQVPQFLSQL
jgi:hypothetical protein